MDYSMKMRGTCCPQVDFSVVDGKVTNIHFLGGCSGNTQGVAALAEGMEVEEVIQKLEGICCGRKPTSCPDQFAKALKETLVVKSK